MKVICAGWGRTGTGSLKYALEILLTQGIYPTTSNLSIEKLIDPNLQSLASAFYPIHEYPKALYLFLFHYPYVR